MSFEPTGLQRALMDFVTSAAEPTWIMLKEMPVTGGDRAVTEAALRELEEAGLVYRTREAGGDPACPEELDDWWALTHPGWSLLGEAKPRRYR